MPNASLANDNQGGNVAAPVNDNKLRMPLGQVLFFHEKRLAFLENRTDMQKMVKLVDSENATAIELLSKRLGNLETQLTLLQKKQQKANAIQFEIEEQDNSEENDGDNENNDEEETSE